MRFLIVVSIFLVGCSNQLSKKQNWKTEDNPPGTVRLNDSLFIDKTEVANVHWREYLFYQQTTYGSESEEFINALLDTLVWSDIENATDLSNIYFRHPSFNNSPAVGMSYEQAIAFCEWRTNAVNLLLSKQLNRKFKRVKYRLPSMIEWELAAADGLDLTLYPYGLKSLYDEKGRLLLHCFQPIKPKDPHFHEPKIYTSSINSFFPNEKGIYQMQGNVSEMLVEKGIAKGGNFTLKLDSCKVQPNHSFTKPEAWLGFRCVCEIVE